MKKIISLVILTILMIQISAQNAPYYKKDGQFVECPTDRATILHPGDTIFNAYYNSYHESVIFDPVPVFWRYYGSSSFEQEAYIIPDSSGFIEYEHSQSTTWIRVVLLEFDNIQDIDTCVNSAYHLTHFVDTTLQLISLSTSIPQQYQTFYEEHWMDAFSVDSVDHEGTFNLLYGIFREVNWQLSPIYETSFNVNLNIKEDINDTINTCYSYTWHRNNTEYTTSGTYEFSDGCDNYHLVLNLSDSVKIEKDTSVCGSYIWNGNTYTESGSYSVTAASQNGCDSIYTLNFIVHDIPTIEIVNIEDSILFISPASDFSYHWNTGSNNDTIFIETSGVYSVTVTNEYGCTNTSSLEVTIIETGIQTEISSFDYYLYPNPAQETIYFKECQYLIYDLTGKIVLSGKASSADVSNLKPGTYFFRTDNFSTKFFKE